MTFYRAEIEAAALVFEIDPDLVEALVLQESSGNADAFRFEPTFYRRYLQDKPEYAGQNPRRISSSYGLCQVMYTTAQQYGFQQQPEALFLPNLSLEYGCRHLSALLKWAKGDMSQALAAYNGGRGGWKAVSPQSYAKQVLGRLAALQAARN